MERKAKNNQNVRKMIKWVKQIQLLLFMIFTSLKDGEENRTEREEETISKFPSGNEIKKFKVRSKKKPIQFYAQYELFLIQDLVL
jgi:hypothetical protein